MSYFTDSDVVSYQDANWYGSGSSWLKVNIKHLSESELSRASFGLVNSHTRLTQIKSEQILKFCKIITSDQVTPWGIRSLVNWVASE